MDRRLALGAALGAPLLFLLLWAASSATSPLAGWALGLLAYWAALALAISRRMDGDTAWQLSRLVSPGRLIAVAMALPVLVLGAATLRLMDQSPVPAVLLLAAGMGALVNGTLEELFWRGALLPRPTPRAAAGALLLFALFHFAWEGARGLDTGGPFGSAVLGALVMGGAWTAARLASGTVGAAIFGHAAFNLFAFIMVVARNAPAG